MLDGMDIQRCSEFEDSNMKIQKIQKMKRKKSHISVACVCGIKTKSSERCRFGRNLSTFHCGLGGIYRYKLCRDIWKRLFSLNHNKSFGQMMADLWEFRKSQEIILELPQRPLPEPNWMPEFEEWFLSNVKYEESHYSVKKTPYLVILPQDVDSGNQSQGQYETATAMNMLRNIMGLFSKLSLHYTLCKILQF